MNKNIHFIEIVFLFFLVVEESAFYIRTFFYTIKTKPFYLSGIFFFFFLVLFLLQELKNHPDASVTKTKERVISHIE